MKKLNFFRSFFLAATLAITSVGFTSCDDKDNVEPELPVEVRGAYDQKGVFILNEGNYGTPNGSISFLSDSANHKVINDIFSKANADRPLGDVVLDLDIVDDKAYITVNNSNKIEVVNAYTFKTEAVLENLKQPRYFVALKAGKGYVTEWIKYGEPGQVSVIDLNTMKVIKSIPVGPQPEDLFIVGDRLYVANSGSNIVTVINTTTDTKLTDIAVTEGPTEIDLDKSGNLWVLSSGIKYTEANTPAALSVINPGSGTVIRTLAFEDPEASVDNLAFNGNRDKLYYSYGGNTYTLDINATAVASTPFISKYFYGIGVDPQTGFIYASEYTFTGQGTIFVYSPEGTQVNSFTAGIGPNGFVFN